MRIELFECEKTKKKKIFVRRRIFEIFRYFQQFQHLNAHYL